MDGRTEKSLKVEKKIKSVLETLPSYVSEYYYECLVSNEPRTKLAYLMQIRGLLTSINEDFSKITYDDIENNVGRYYDSKKSKVNPETKEVLPCSNAYRALVLAEMKDFCNFMTDKGYLKHNPTTHLKRSKAQDIVKRHSLTEEDLKAILEAVDNYNDLVRNNYTNKEFLKDRDRLILLIFMNTGIREEALSEINIEDIDTESWELVVRDKGNKVHLYELYHIKKNIQDYLDRRKMFMAHSEDEVNALFVGYKSYKRMDAQAIITVVRTYTSIGIGFSLSPHKLRAAYCTILYSKTKDIDFVRKAVGHSSITTTQRYIVDDGSTKKKSADIMYSVLK